MDGKRFYVVAAITLALAACGGGRGENAVDGAPTNPAASTPATNGPATPVGDLPRPALLDKNGVGPSKDIQTCNLEQINGADAAAGPAKQSRTTPFKAAGWVVDPGATKFELRMINEENNLVYVAPLTRNVVRDDVSAMSKTSEKNLGFGVELDVSDVQPGTYKLQLVSTSPNAVSGCFNGRTLELTP